MNVRCSGYRYRLSGVSITPGVIRITLFLMTLLLLTFRTADAAYLKNVPQTLTQPDQTILHCFATGDEYHHWLHDANGYTIVQDSITGYFVYAVKNGSRLAPSGFIAGKTDPAAVGLKPGLNLDAETVRAIRKTRLAIPALKGSNGVMTTGTINNIVIFIRFSGQPEFSEPASRYSDAFNATGTVSMKEYFKEVSGSQLTVNTTLYPRAGSTVVSYQDSKTRDYYCKYNAVTNPSGYQNDTERSVREMALLRDATQSLASQIEAAGLNFDADGNGQVDNVCYIVQGSTDGWAELLWPHMWALYEHTVTIGGARVFNYNFQMSETFGVSVVCHEMGHSLGFPDLYRYCDNTTNPVGPWDVMSSSTNPPQHPGIYMKHKYGGWINEIPQITSDGTYSLKPLSSDPFAGFRINSPNSASEYFVLEYRRTAGRFESQLLGSGLVITRVSPSVNGNSYGPPDEVYVFRPDGTTTVDGNLAQAHFSSNEGRTVFGGSGPTGCFLSDGSPGGFRITNIGSAGETISFTVAFGEDAPPVLSVAPLTRDFPVSGGSTSFSVTNSGEGSMLWSAAITTGSNWVSIQSGNSGTNSGTIQVVAEANGGDSPRTATIIITADNVSGGPKTLTLTQAGTPAVLSVLPSERTIDHTAGSLTYAVSNTGGGTMNWSAVANNQPDWFRITSGANGTNSGSIQVSADANPGNESRQGSITITTTGSTAGTKTVTITQTAQPAILNVLPDARSLPSGSSTTTFEVNNTGGGSMGWTAAVSSGNSWLEILSGTSGVNSGTITVATTENSDNGERSGMITIITSGSSSRTITVYVYQEGGAPVLSVSPENSIIDYKQTDLEFEVVNLGTGVLNWEAFVSTGSSWAHITSGSSGSDSGSIRMSIDANPDNQFREATVIVSNTATGENPRTLTIIQNANRPVLSVDHSTRTIRSTGGTFTINIDNMGGGTMRWAAAISWGDQWARIITGNAGSNHGSVTLEIHPNYGNQRAAILNITTDEATGMQVPVQIIQEAKIAEIVIDPDVQHVDSNSTFVSFGVSKTGVGSIRWTAEVSSGDSWAHISQGTSGSNEGIISVDVDANPGSPRTAIITVTSPDSASYITTLTIRQDIANGTDMPDAGNTLSIFPNPATSHCFIEMDSFDGQSRKLEIFNMMGQLESTRLLFNRNEQIDMNALPQGVYVFRITSGNNIVSQSRVVKN